MDIQLLDRSTENSAVSLYLLPSRLHVVDLEVVCGDVSDVTTNGGTYVDNSECNMACSGDPIYLCGGPGRLTTCCWTGTPLYDWNTPENMRQQHGGEHLSTPNSTGAYELDISLADNYKLAWREMHVQTDVFCSGSIILLIKAPDRSTSLDGRSRQRMV
ncbi:hypothetical protein J3R82DRAFT_7816 [Butyriboletus roseoflavus]|nr:hypothetical protein J3R82DRAFT_7816 [Butyriboletus roseoflavus]